MPGIEELKKFREEIASLGDERKVTEERDGVYEELPLPPEPLESGKPSAGAKEGFQEDFAAEGEGTADFSDISLDDDLASPADIDAGDIDLSALEDDIPSPAESSADFSDISLDEDLASPADSEAGDIDLSALGDDIPFPTESGADFSDISLDDDLASPADSEAGDIDLSALDEMLSSLQLDDTSDIGEGEAPANAQADSVELPDISDEGFDALFPKDFESEAPEEQEAEKAAAEDADVLSISDDLTSDEAAKEESAGEGAMDGAAISSGLDLDELEGFDDSIFDSDFLADFGGGEEEVSADSLGAEGDEPLAGSLDLGALDNLESGEDDSAVAATADEEFPAVATESGLETAGESAPAEGDDGGFEGLQSLDGFDFDETALNAAISGAAAAAQAAGAASTKKAAGKAGKKPAKKAVPTELTEEEFSRFLYLLSRFPLNLRVAVEEFLAETQAGDEQKMELVASILAGASLKKVAGTLENYLDRTIQIPKDFEKKNFEEYQLEKSSLKYVLLNKVLPIASITGIILILAACVTFLSYQFIYRPVSAERLYRRGYQALEDERYNQAEGLFNRASERWAKKKWYFSYARGYREKNQYIAAENIYLRLLERFDNDLEGGLEYADMLRSDLQNYERAETVLRRRVLDYHPNNLDALLLLGDVFLDWAEEDPSKYEQARLQYATAISFYGETDNTLARMMRYYIRTNSLAEVLPLKEHFMEKRAKIGAEDLIELGGYLLEKRYMPSAGDSDALRDTIGDLREILERGLDAGPSIPEGHYNMGRFWIYNYAPERAAASLTEAIRLFVEEGRLSRRRVIGYVDSYRLLGEIRASEREYLIAQELYAAGISIYEERKAARSVPQDERVGRLYADYADIDYFISNDWDSALRNYSQAVAELCDTPSIRYRIGYIHYQRAEYALALPQFIRSYSENNSDGNILYALGNTLFRRESWNAARGYYERLMEMSEAERVRKGIILPQTRSDHGEFVEQYMHAANNLGVTLYNIAGYGRDATLRGRAYSLFSESARAWDALTRNPDTMIRAQGTNLAYLNMQNITAPLSGYTPEIYSDIPKTLSGERALQGRRD